MQSFQIASFALMFYFHAHSTTVWLNFNVIPFEVYAIVTVLLLIASMCLYCGIFRVNTFNWPEFPIIFFFLWTHKSFEQQLSNVFTIIGLLLLLFLMHALFAIVLIIYIDGSESIRRVRAEPILSKATHRTALFPGLWICAFANLPFFFSCGIFSSHFCSHSRILTGVWTFVLMRMFYFFMKMQEFKKHPPFVRRSMHLIRAVSSLAATRSTAV